MLSCYHSTPYFWERVLFKKTFYCVLFSIWNIRIKILFLILVYSCYMICLTRCNMFGMCYAREVVYWGCGMLGMLEMWDVGDEGCWGCPMLEMCDVGDVGFGDVGCLGCGMFGMWDVGDVGCWRCGIIGMWDVGCGMFVGMWHVDLQSAFQTIFPFLRTGYIKVWEEN